MLNTLNAEKAMSDLGTVVLDFVKNLFAFDQAHPLLFTQFYFWAFFAIVLAFLSLMKNRILLRNAFLFAVSLFFYYKTSGLFLMLLISVVLYCYLAGLLMPKVKKKAGKRLLLLLSVVFNLSLLFYYKYAYFVTDIINNLAGTSFEVHDWIASAGNSIVGAPVFSIESIFLPVGISFFIFQAISYVVDVRKDRIEPVRNFLDFGFYLSFFPQLVAGPIVRATEFIPQLHKPFFLSRHHFGLAVFWILNGLAKKLILSDFIAVNLCDRVFENPLLYTGFENLLALFCYSLQVYADFSGYTDIATGVAMLMGFHLPKNFNSPYKARNAGEFWKRWHISLSKWLQDYLYIPLGGNRNGTVWSYAIILGIGFLASALARNWWVFGAVLCLTVILSVLITFCKGLRKELISNINRMDTMLLGGLWHGASWNFMIWGGLNGLGMLIYRFWHRCNVYVRALVITLICIIFRWLAVVHPASVFNLFFVWTLIIAVGAVVHMLYHMCRFKAEFRWLDTAWSVLMTFIFITFTRLFFRSGSNLDPAEANEQAWNTAKNMVERIGGHWDLSLVPDMAVYHKNVILVFIFGMIIHWLPERFKRRYRIWFLRMPLPVMVAVCVLAVFVIYQFITSDLQSFIYFQF
ncbi:MAG: MBOAT family protein [Bacteroidales bacterium]|nr:MBOAT family protein [Bacteroidales bacterium]